ncbi:MAG: hypothetical protein Q9191_002795 [Dirinaria sp. TL-2023a]
MVASSTGDDYEDEARIDIPILQASLWTSTIYKRTVGKNTKTRERRNAHGVQVSAVHAATRKTLLKVKGFSEVKVEKIKEAIQKLQPSKSGFITAVELGHQRKRVVKISTGSKQLDSILGGSVTSV